MPRHRILNSLHNRVLQVVQPPLGRKDVGLVAAQFAAHGPAVAAQGRNDAVGIGVGHFHPLFDGLAGGVVVAQGGGLAGHFVVYRVAQQVAEVAHMRCQVGVAPGVQGVLFGRKMEVAGHAVGVGFQGGKAVLAFVAPHQRFGERFEHAVIRRAPGG